jgi:hypothetical protein
MTTNLQKGFTDELKIITARSALGAVAGENFETATMDRIGKNANFPLRMFASFPTPSAVLNFESSNLELGSGVGRSVPPIESVVPTVAASTLNFQTGSTTGATFTVEGGAFALPSTTVGQFRRAAFALNSNGNIDIKFSAANAVLGSLENPGALFDSLTGIPIGWIDLEATASTAYKTAGSATAIVENKVSGTSRINIFGQLVAASGGGKGTVDRVIQAAHGFVLGDLLYLNGATYTKGLATAAVTAEIVGMVSRVVDVNTFEITLSGEVTGLVGLTAGATYFLSRSVAGGYTATEPNTLGDVSLPIGVASSTTSMYVAVKRGAIVGAVNARSDIALANNTTTNVQDVSAYQAGQLAGWVEIDGTVDSKFHVAAAFAKKGDGTDYNISPQYVGDTPPVGFSMTVTSVGLIQVTLPNVAGFLSAKINFSLNAPAVGATFPLAIDSTNVQFSTLKAKDSSGFALQNSSGTQIASLDNSGNFSVAGNGQGIVPLGAVIAMTTGITGSMAVPASGSASFGWQRADGVAIAGGSTLSGNTPNLSGSVFLRGATTYGGTGGSNTYTPAGTNSTSNVPASGLGFSGSSTSYSVSVPGHYHGVGTLTNSTTGLPSGATSCIDGSTRNTHITQPPQTGNANGVWATTASLAASIVNAYPADAGIYMPPHTHSISGNAGNTGGPNGDGAFTASGNNTPSGSITGTATAAAQIFTGTPGNNEPSYINVIYLMRVK